MNIGERITVIVEGHQLYHRITGEILAWTMTVEPFGTDHRGHTVYLQVPAVILRMPESSRELIRVVPLAGHLKHMRVERPNPERDDPAAP